MKSVFIIAIVAFAMIGVMIPSSFAESTYVIEPAIGSAEPGCEWTEQGCYTPKILSVNKGDTVIFSNTDSAAHTFTSGNPPIGPSGVFDSSLLMAGLDYSFTFNDAGNYDYFCMVHPWMVGSVTVN